MRVGSVRFSAPTVSIELVSVGAAQTIRYAASQGNGHGLVGFGETQVNRTSSDIRF